MCVVVQMCCKLEASYEEWKHLVKYTGNVHTQVSELKNCFCPLKCGAAMEVFSILYVDVVRYILALPPSMHTNSKYVLWLGVLCIGLFLACLATGIVADMTVNSTHSNLSL